MKALQSFILGLSFILSNVSVKGQADSIMSLPSITQTQALYVWFEANTEKDSTWFLPRIDQMRKDFIAKDREELSRSAWCLRIRFLLIKYYPDEEKRIRLIDRAIAEANENGWKIQEAELYVEKGFTLQTHGRHVNAFANLLKGYELMKQTGFEKFAILHSLLYKIGLAYFYVKAYDQAGIYMRQSLEAPRYRPEPKFATVAYNTLGLCYMMQLQYDSAIVAFQKSHDAAVEADMKAYMGLTQGNIGFAYFKKGDDDKALPLLEEDFKVSNETGEFNSALNASLALSTIYLKRGLRDKAEYHIQFASKYVKRDDDRAMQSYFENLSGLREIAGELQSALNYRDSAAYYLARVETKEEKDILERARLELEIEKHTSTITSLESLRKRQLLTRNGLLMMVMLIGIIVLSLIQRRYLKRKRELDKAQKELTMFTNMVREKNEMLDLFSHEIETLRATDEHSQDERSQHLTSLMHSQILTEEDWNQFRVLFDKVHPGFFGRLKEKIPDLSAAETRLLAMTKLQLAPREMASMLGISYNSILKSRQRFRKKFNLQDEEALDELIRKI